ncbi:MAG: ribosome biogenesis GTP-binding protein YihA/YsxC, partial [Pseudomonadota bacterium]
MSEYTPEQIEAGRLLFARPVEFMLSAVSLDTLPPMGPPEVCFAGRSNVGKSTLINALTNHAGLARASNTPGRTQELNYFDAQGRLRLVDLPGYGFAKAPKHKVQAWTRLTRAFLRG